jgi:hypothetical protein
MNLSRILQLGRMTLLLISILTLSLIHISHAQQPDAQLSLGLVIHLEGWPLDENEQVLTRYEDIVLDYADLFEQYGAKLTLETNNTADAILQYEGRHNFLLALQERGHAVGVHADLGGRPGLSYNRFVTQLQQMKRNQETLGLDVRHVSGICSYLDWVSAAVEAGFESASSSVAYCYSSMPEEDRPEAYRDCPNPAACHQFVPESLASRLQPWRAVDGSNWPEHNPDGQLVLFPSSGTLNCFTENRTASESFTSCDFVQDDIDNFMIELNEALSIIQPDQANTYYVVWSLGGQLNTFLLEQWLQAIDTLVQSGEVVWRTLPEMADLYSE